MPITNVTGPGGVIVPVKHPEGASESEIIAYAKANYTPVAAPAAPIASAPELPAWAPGIVKTMYGSGAPTLPGDGPAALPPDASEATRAGANLPRAQRSMLAAAQGTTFGFGDEISGGVLGGAKTIYNGKPYSRNYTDVRDSYRAAVDRQLRDEPWTTASDQFIASLPVGGPLVKAFRFKPASGITDQVVQAMGVGGVSGAANAAGNSPAPTVAGVANDALLGTGLGLAMGGFGIPLVRSLGAVGGNLISRFDDSAAMNYARQKIAQAFDRDAAPGVSTPLAQAGARLDKLGAEARLVDAGGQSGQNVKALLDTTATLPGRTKTLVETAIHDRQAGRADRMIGSAEGSLGVGGVRLAPQLEDWVQQRGAQAAPLYQRLHQMDVPASQELSSIVDAARANGYHQSAARIATNSRLPFTLPEDASTLTGTYSMRDLDLLKQGMDSSIAKMYNPLTGKLTPEGQSADQLRRALLAQLDRDTMGQYAAARNAYAGPSALIDAAGAGRRILSSDDASIRALMSSYTTSERDAFSLGAFESLRAKAGAQAGQTELMGLWRQKGMQEKLKAIFGDERSYREFAAANAGEARMKGLESVGRGSQTASRHAAMADLDTSALGAAGGVAGSLASGNVLGAATAGGRFWNYVSTPEPIRDTMGRILLSRGADAQDNLLSMQAAMRQVQAARRNEAVGLGLGIGSQSGNVLGLLH